MLKSVSFCLLHDDQYLAYFTITSRSPSDGRRADQVRVELVCSQYRSVQFGDDRCLANIYNGHHHRLYICNLSVVVQRTREASCGTTGPRDQLHSRSLNLVEYDCSCPHYALRVDVVCAEEGTEGECWVGAHVREAMRARRITCARDCMQMGNADGRREVERGAAGQTIDDAKGANAGSGTRTGGQ